MSKLSGVYYLFQIVFLILLSSCNSNTSSKNGIVDGRRNITIGLLQYKGFDSTRIISLQKGVSQFYQCNVIVLPAVDLPEFAFYPLRNRYRADSLLVFEKGLESERVSYIAGLTDKDISTTMVNKSDWGIFGLGYCPGNVCVISSFRLQRASKTEAQLNERLLKVVLLEIGHNFGLPHCAKNPECIMTDANGTIKQIDKEKKWLCESCRFKLGK